jgi:molybdopterin/thiamine biosynthesis adenylyltransferase
MQNRYLRNIPALSEEECKQLQIKRVLIVGCGGLGGNLISILLRIDVGNLRIVDGDVFEPSNLNRQLFSSVSALGQNKARIAAQSASDINPDVHVDVIEEFFTEENAAALLQDCDIVLDALDNIPSRRLLAAACEKAGLPLIYGAISGWVSQAAISLPGDRLIDTLYPEDIVIRDKSVLSFTPSLCASMQAALCIKLLVGRPVETGTIYYFDLLNQEFETIPMV